MCIRPLGSTDLHQMAVAHLAAFPGSLLTRLGIEAVRRSYVPMFSAGPRIVVLGIDVNGSLAAFALGGVFCNELRAFLMANRLFLLGRLLRHPGVLLSPEMRSRVGTGLRVIGAGGARCGRDASYVPHTGTFFGIQAIAVDPARQGRGLGTQLMAAMEAAARERGFSRMLLTVHPSNTQARAFYERTGWQPLVAPSRAWEGILIKPL